MTTRQSASLDTLMRLLRYLKLAPRLSLAIAIILGVACLFTIVNSTNVCCGFPSLQTNATLITGRGNLVIWGWRHPGRYYPHLILYPMASGGDRTYAEVITTYPWWVTAFVPLAGVRHDSITLTLPVLLPFLGFAALSAWQIRGAPVARRRRLIAAGLCPNCEYDLRASDDRCPECGTTRFAAA